MEYLPKIINSLGLLCDIAGAFLIYNFGLPTEISRSGANHLVLGKDEEEAKKAEKYDYWAKKGLILLITGFVLQLVSNFASYFISYFI